MKILVLGFKIMLKFRIYILTLQTLFESEQCMEWRFRGFSNKKFAGGA